MQPNKPIFSLQPLSKAIAALVSTSLSSPAPAQLTDDQSGEGRGPIDEIVVTATRRREDAQDIPQSIHALTAEDIHKRGLDNIQDYEKSIPGLSSVSTSPGRSEVVFRGVSTGTGEWRTDSGSAVYLGEIPMTSATQAVDPRLVDIERVEALPGPQGTLFGSSSQSGALRIIPNRPDHAGVHGSVSAGASATSAGSPGYYVESYANLPLVKDKLALRAVLFDSQSGGFIDNVYGRNIFTDDDNADRVEEDFNTWAQRGGRVSALWSFNEQWDAELMVMRQEQRSQGDWKADPAAPGLKDLEIVRFHKDYRDDQWWTAALSLRGDLGFSDLTLTASYLDREIFYEFDANNNAQIRAQRVRTPGDSLFGNVRYDTAFQPETTVNDQSARRSTFEARLLSAADSRFKWMLGAFYEQTDDDWDYDFGRVKNLKNTPFGAYWELGSTLPDTDSWYNEEYRATTEQLAVYGEMRYDIGEKWALRAGSRWFQYERDRREFKNWPKGNPYDVDIYRGKDDDTLYKFALDHRLDDERMLYALYSEGFRLGGFNSIKNPDSVLPDRYGPDTLTNVEIGLKSEWLDNSLQVNAALYRMDWRGIQRGITDPDDWTANGTVNMGDARLRGVELSMTWHISERLLLEASFTEIESALEDDYFLRDLVPLADPANQDQRMGAKGQELAIAPPRKWWLGVEYRWPELLGAVGARLRYDHWFQAAMHHDWWNAMNAKTGNGGRKLIKEAREASVQLSLDVEGSWDLTVSIWNLWNERNSQWIDSSYSGAFGPEGTWPGVRRYVNMPGYNQPRQFEIRFTKWFGSGS